MQESINTKQKELLTTQKNVENNLNKNSTLTEQEKIEGTPFTLIKLGYEDNSCLWFIVMGDHRITDPTETKEEQLEKLKTEMWLIIMHVSIIVQKKINENPIIHDMDEQETDKKWESPRDREKRTRQEYKPIK